MVTESDHTSAVSSSDSERMALDMSIPSNLSILDEEWKRKQHRANMVEFRVKKKNQLQKLRKEHHHLECVMKEHVATLQYQSQLEATPDTVPTMMGTIRDLVLTIEEIRGQNLVLRQLIELHQNLKAMVQSELPTSPQRTATVLPGSGWWVYFHNNAPAFYYQPFLPEEVADIPNPLDHGFIADMPATALVGTLLGWKVYRELSRPYDASEELVSRMRLTKRVNCSLDRAYTVARAHEKDLRPLLVTPVGWSSNDHHKVSVQVVQEINPDCFVMVHHIPGPTSIRYMFLSRTAQWNLHDGKRRMEFSMIIVDSTKNKFNRDAMIPQDNIEWAQYGWVVCTMTEIDEHSIDVIYEHCAGYDDEKQAGQLTTQWAQFMLRWEQLALPSNLLVGS